MFLNIETAAVGRWARYLGLVLALGLVGCSGDDAAVTPPGGDAAATETEGPVVVASTSVICDLTEQVAETTVALTCLLEPGVDPHTYQVKPSDRQAIEQADLILYDGYSAAPRLIAMVQDSSTAAERVAVYEAAVPNPLMGAAHDHDHGTEANYNDGDEHSTEAAHDHEHGDEDTHSTTTDAELVPDPHVWHNAVHNAAMATVIAEALAQVNPDQAAFYSENADRLASQFAEIDRWIQAQVATVPANQRQLVTTHEAFGYFADAYGFEVKGALSGLSTDQKPTPGALTALVDQVKAAQAPAIFAENTTNPELIESVAKDAGVAVAEQPLYVEGPGEPGSDADTVQAMLVANTCTVVEALGGNCDRASAPL
ncbi:metal ABC transporter solute-binding protein, Zn/Mn family [Nodosilinea sp. AN01ver1]|uniref:metal ABC transporter solute-binding protein, Zn/Mn family n=1 Tax=Nodosilinea sp. AN01ver1 TaxID=3423362 RepID=UPI003D3122F1